MDEKSLELLEFPRVREILAKYTGFSGGSRLALALRPLSNYDEVCRRLEEAREAYRLRATDPNFSLGEISDITETVRRTEIGLALDPEDLLQVANTLASLRQLRQRLAGVSREFPLLWETATGITEMPEIEQAITKCIHVSGEILDSASPALAATRTQLKTSQQGLMEYLGNLIHSPRLNKVLQDELITERHGRYVIPIKADARHRIKGIVHDISNTGATVFLEPSAAIERGNEIRSLEIAEQHEVARILEELSGRVGSRSGEIRRNLELSAVLDLTIAKAKYAAAADAITPKVIDPASEPAPELRLVSARHPLLGRGAVPLNMEIGGEFTTLVITGPNMGGKTVALKTAGLLSLMTASGMPIPAAEGTRIPLYDNIFSDIGDEQSIEQTMSTFSWHVTNLVRFVSNVTPRSLVLLDELGSSTDPTEGSALARSVLKYLNDRRVTTIATTHHNDLKAFAYVTSGMQNASMDFDATTQQPTYRLRLGVPGGSNALATATRLGLDPAITEAARQLLSSGDQELQDLLSHLREEREELRLHRAKMERDSQEISRQHAELATGFEQLERDRRTIIQETRDKVLSEAAELHRDIRQAARELRREQNATRLNEARRSLENVRERLSSETWTPPPSTGDTTPTEAPLAPGDTVSVRGLNIRGKVVTIYEAANEVEIQAGQSRLRLSRGSITRTEPASEAAPITSPPPAVPAAPPVSLELDLRGKRAHEIETLLDSYLNDAALAGLHRARIIHGFGTGALRSTVRDLLATHPLAASFHPGQRDEGGDGVTVVEL